MQSQDFYLGRAWVWGYVYIVKKVQCSKAREQMILYSKPFYLHIGICMLTVSLVSLYIWHTEAPMHVMS